ncbi:MAG TPA: FtsX-like permease family protein, partial [Longimicrobiales bacterium]
ALRRRKEIAVRLALGVSRRRLVAQLLTESVLLALLGGAAGLLVARWGGAILRAQLLPKSASFPILSDFRTMLFAGAAALVVGVLAGLAPVLQSGHLRLGEDLRSGGRDGTPGHSRLRTALLVLQGGLSVVLLVGAGLFVRSLHNVRSLPLGWQPDSVLIVNVNLRGVRLDSARDVNLRESLLEAARVIPGVTHATRTIMVPFQGEWDQDIYVAGIDSTARLGIFTLNAISPEYFSTMGTPILHGRGFTAADRAGAPPVMVVSQAMAHALWPGRDALGQCARLGADTVPCTYVVGVAQTEVQQTLGSPDPGLQYYLPVTQVRPPFAGGLLVRTSASAATFAETVRRSLQHLLPGDAYVTVTPFSDVLSDQTRSWRLGATMFLVFGLLALVLAAVGLYGVIAYGVAQRTREMGIRIALGASLRDVLSLVVGQGLRVTAAGVGLGALVAFVAAPRVQPLLFQESPRDPFVYAAVAAALLLVALAASLLPARRAARVDPQEALRAE